MARYRTWSYWRDREMHAARLKRKRDSDAAFHTRGHRKLPPRSPEDVLREIAERLEKVQR